MVPLKFTSQPVDFSDCCLQDSYVILACGFDRKWKMIRILGII